jgi:ATP-dependent helicase/nuclease subunit A
MTNISITQLQQTASNPNNSAWVFASAGSGKTKILTDRVLRLLLDDVLPNKILCLTFTNNAATEMQNRINDQLARWAICADEELEKNLLDLSGVKPTKSLLQKARNLFIKVLDDDAKIKVQTIHAFCQNLIRLFPLEVGVNPNFEVIEEIREKLLLKQAQKELVKQALNGDENLKNIIGKINGELHESTLDDLLFELLGKKEKLLMLQENFGDITNVAAEIFAAFGLYEDDNVEKIFAKFLAEFDRAKISNVASKLTNSSTKTNRGNGEKIQKFLDDATYQNFSIYREALLTKENTVRKISSDEGKDEILLEIVNRETARILDFVDRTNSLQISQDTALLLNFAGRIIEIYQQLKKQNAFLDYNDLIHETNRLLADSNHAEWVKLKMDGTFDHILVDESQDTNQAQWLIIKALSEDFFSGLSANNNKRSIFIVGDEKQSIYSFQGAEPHISEEIFAYFKNKLGDQLKKIELNNSFRSSKKVLAMVDAVFDNPARKHSISRVSEFKSHQSTRLDVGKVEIWDKINCEEELQNEGELQWKIDFSDIEENQNEKILAEKISQKIRQMIDEKQILPSTGKAANYGDFMILLRKRTNEIGRIIEKTFHQFHIPFASISRVKFSESLLVSDLLAAAKFALFQDDDLNLACLLKSPLIRISEENLLELCIKKNHDESSLYQAISTFPGFDEIKEFLSELISSTQKYDCAEFFYFLLNDKNRKKIISAFGLESAQILDKFTLMSADFCKNFSPHLQKFLEFAQDFDPEISLAATEENCVRISTIHAAKGLQAPVIFLPDCAYNSKRLAANQEAISWLGTLPIWCRKKELENSILEEHRKQKNHEAKEENLRLLYVALTRAQDELYITGFGNDADEECWYEIARQSTKMMK